MQRTRTVMPRGALSPRPLLSMPLSMPLSLTLTLSLWLSLFSLAAADAPVSIQVTDAAALAAASAAVDRTDPAVVLAHKGDAVITQAEIDAAFSRIPEEHRLAFIRDGAKVDRLLQSLMQNRIVALEAVKDGYARDQLMVERMRLAAEKELAEAWVAEVMRRAPAADYAAMAQEKYISDPETFRPPARLDVAHVLIGLNDRSADEAAKLAAQLRRQLDEDPEAFDQMITEYSDDSAKLTNFGLYKDMTRGQMVKPFEDAAYALGEPGQFSEPVKTEYGYHIIRLDARAVQDIPPLEEIREQLEGEMESRHLEAYRTRYLQNLLAAPLVLPEGAVDAMVRRHFGDSLEKAPIFTEDGPVIGEQGGE